VNRRRSYGIAGIEIRIETDDAGFIAEFSDLCGGSAPDRAEAVLQAALEAGDADEGRLVLIGDDLTDAPEFVLSMASNAFPFVPGPPNPHGVAVALGDPSAVLFVFGRDGCRFRKVPRWRRMLAHFVFLRALRLRRDVLFFHAASVAMDGRGVLLAGPKGSGKTTLSLALGARGHAVLGDETAAYVPASRQLLTMRRPANIKPGPRSREIDRLVQSAGFERDEDGHVRVPLERLFGEAAPARLHAVAFLRGFAAVPGVVRSQPGREALRSLQPLATTLRDSKPRSVLDMAVLLAEARCFEVSIGDADATAAALEAAVAGP
jgi:hypothetical protein